MADISIDRSYIDNNAVKEFVTNKGVLEKFFPDIDVDLRTVGMLGWTSEVIANETEDVFNTSSVLFRETFPNRAQLNESIYSHAAIFQIDDIFSTAASCKFVLILEESAIIANMRQDESSEKKNEYYFYIDKNTIFFVEGHPFSIDYDIKMTINKRPTESGKDDYIFSARYITEEYKNSISSVNDPYIKMRRSSDGYIALDIWTHQCIRDIREEELIENLEVNYPTVDIKYSEKLAGFDVLYQEPGSEEWVQLDRKIVYSHPQTTPFCYYQLVKDGLLRISFNTKAIYFMPEFNSKIQVILYITEGSEGNFEVYNGNNISIVPNYEKYQYNTPYLTAAAPSTASENGADEKDIDAIQALTVEGYRTANALTTDNDLQVYFNNYKYRFGNSDILFIRKRDDIYERIFSAFMIVRKDNYVYHTNTLHLRMNMYDMNTNDQNIFILEPGTVFTANDTSGYAEFYRNEELNLRYYNEYLIDVANGKTPFIEDTTDQEEIPSYLKRPCSFAQWKRRKGYDDTMRVWELTNMNYSEDDVPSKSKFLLVNPFLIKFTKSPNFVSTYMTFVNNNSSLDFTKQNDDMFMQFVAYSLIMTRTFSSEKCYNIKVNVTTTSAADAETPIIAIDKWLNQSQFLYHLNDKYSLANNDFRLFFCVMDDDGEMICFSELTPTAYDGDADYFSFETTLYTDDHITSNGKLRLLPRTIYRNPNTGEYYKVHDDDNTLYDKFNANDEIMEQDISSTTVQALINNQTIVKYEDVMSATNSSEILVPVNDCTVKIIPIYRRDIDEVTGDLEIIDVVDTDNPFYQFDDGLAYKNYASYKWTNEFATISEPVAFIRDLESIRSTVTFEDFTEATENSDGTVSFAHDIFDITMLSIGFLSARTANDQDLTDYFFKSFWLHYNFLQESVDTRVRNQTGIDIKFYNTYGMSKNFVIGEDEEPLDTVNISLAFDIWFVQGTDISSAITEVKYYIKEVVESVNEKGMNDLFISNLMRKVESRYSYVDHMRFKNINAYDSTYQAIKNRTTDISLLPVEERRWYVPELLVCEIEDISITEYTAS